MECQLFEKINSIDIPVHRLTKRQGQNTEIIKLVNEAVDITATLQK